MKSIIHAMIQIGSGLDIEIDDVVDRTVADSAELIEASLENGKGVWYQRDDGSVRVIGPEALRSAVILIEPSTATIDQVGS